MGWLLLRPAAVPRQRGSLPLFALKHQLTLDVVYWGDIDTHGFAILSLTNDIDVPLREFYSSVDVVTSAYADVPFSELLHHPAATADRLSRVRALRLRRRDAGDLALMRIEQLERDGTVIDFAARLLAGLIRSGNAVAVREVLPEALPWTVFLPDDDVSEFLAELAAVAGGAADLDNFAPVAVLLAQWRHTAEVHADPALRELITREPEGDLGPVPEPGR